MKKIITLLISVIIGITSYAQVNLDDFGRISLNTYLAENLSISLDAQKLLITKLDQITSSNGIGGNGLNPRFIITANVNIVSKDIIPGPPQMIAQNIDITFFVGDAISKTSFSNITISLKGVGINENKALIEAFKSINPKNKNLATFLEEGKSKILNYYNTQCDFIIKDAKVLTKLQKYDEAIYQLTLVPEVCKNCYFKCLDTLSHIYQEKIDADCKVKFNQAKAAWASSQNQNGAEKAGEILSTINPLASCQSDISAYYRMIDAKLKADEKERWQFKLKQYSDRIAAKKEQVRIAEEKGKRDDSYRDIQSIRNFELDKMRINSYREVAIEVAKNQPKSVTYNNIIWR
jgi:predicted Rdx family selenoprotein